MQGDSSVKKIHFIHGPAMESLKKLEEREAPFDMVFIDADKSAYMDYLRWSNKNLKPGGLLVGDNTFSLWCCFMESRKKEQDEKALKIMKQFNKEMADSGEYISTLIPTEEGLTVGMKRYTGSA